MENIPADVLLERSIQSLNELKGSSRERAIRLVAQFADYIRMQAAGGGAGPTPVPVPGAGASSGVASLCPHCGNSIKIVLGP